VRIDERSGQDPGSQTVILSLTPNAQLPTPKPKSLEASG
jgi:hypothetical protein